jgi:hypothetical protein
MRSLISNKWINDESIELKLLSATEGASPALVSTKKSLTVIKSPTFSSPTHHLRRCTSMIEKPVSEIPDFTSPVSRPGFKRPAAPHSNSAEGKTSSKRRKHGERTSCPFLTTSSTSMDSIVRVCSLTDKPNLTADGIRQLLLPTVLGSNNNRDLNNIDCHALAKLVEGHYSNQVILLSSLL